MDKKAYDKKLMDWGKKALHGLDESQFFVGILGGEKPLSASRLEFLLHVGYSVVNDKTIIIPVPYGMEVPKKLAAVADRIVRYDPNDLKTLHQNIRVVLTELGVIKQ